VSSGNVDLVRSIYDRWEAGDYTDISWADPEIEYTLKGGTDPGLYRGPEAMGRAWAEWLDAFEDFSVHAEEMIEEGDRVLVMVRFGGRAKGSGVAMEAIRDRGANLFEIRGGRVVKLFLYGDRDEARADLRMGS
jgi:ketosteroid isomerase-like protein